MAARSSRAAGRFLTLWLPAAVLVPAVLAGVALAWPGQRIGDDLAGRASAALVAVGLDGVAVHVSGRDVGLAAVPAGSEAVATAAVAGVDGVRVVAVEPGTGIAPPVAPSTGPEVAPLPRDRQALAAQLAGLMDAAPVTFDADSAELTGAAASTVARVAAVLAARPDVPVDLAGYAADTQGSADVAVALSERRARAVAAALAAGGVEPARITAKGWGATRPLSTTTASRRVEISVR